MNWTHWLPLAVVLSPSNLPSHTPCAQRLDGLKAKVAKLLRQGTAFHADDYVAWFGLDITAQQSKYLPDAFAKKCGISKGYMTFLVVEMLNVLPPASVANGLLMR